MGQGAVKRRWGVKFYALAISIGVHVAALSIFAAIKLSQASPISLNTTTVVSINQAAVLAERPVTAPKPKVNPASINNRIVKYAGTGPVTNSQPLVELPKEKPQFANPMIESPQPEGVGGSNENNKREPANVEFFDSPAQGRRICFVVDCSGSMQGLWPKVKTELLDSIGQLQPDQYFSVVVFGAGSIMESGGGWLIRATDKTKSDAEKFVYSVEPRGMTNASAALEHAIKIRDKTNVAPSVIYFLTDGFELNEKDNFKFAHQVETMLKIFAPKTIVNTIGFWPEEKDKILLDMIARQSGGKLTIVGESKEQKGEAGYLNE